MVPADHRDVPARRADSHRLQHDVADAARSGARRVVWFLSLFFLVHLHRPVRFFVRLFYGPQYSPARPAVNAREKPIANALGLGAVIAGIARFAFMILHYRDPLPGQALLIG